MLPHAVLMTAVSLKVFHEFPDVAVECRCFALSSLDINVMQMRGREHDIPSPYPKIKKQTPPTHDTSVTHTPLSVGIKSIVLY